MELIESKYARVYKQEIENLFPKSEHRRLEQAGIAAISNWRDRWQ